MGGLPLRSETPGTTGGRSLFRRLLSEPVVQFLAAGAVLFAASHLLTTGAAVERRDEITVSADRIAELEQRYKAVWGRLPTDAERAGLIDDWLREEVFYREALSLGLDRDDPVIRARMRQKIEVMAEEEGAAQPVTDAEAQAYLRDHSDRYRLPGRAAFRQVTLTSADPETVADIRDKLLAGVAPDSLTAVRMLPVENPETTLDRIAAVFGPQMVASLAGCPIGSWCGPVDSGFGPHLVLVLSREEGRLPDLDEVRDAVQRDIEADRRHAAVDAHYAALKADYSIRVEQSAGPGP